MKYAQSSAVYFHHSLEYAIKDLHGLGYDGIEIWGGRPHMYRNDLDEQLPELAGLLKKLDMRVCNFIPAQFHYPSVLCSDNETVRRESVAYIKTAMDNAVRIGSPSVSLCPGMTLFDRDVAAGWRQLKRSLAELAEYNTGAGLHLLIEPAHRFESNLIGTVDDCLRMMDELRSDHFGILLDTGHAHLNGEDFRDTVRKCHGLPLHIHLDDNRGDADAHLIPGRGTVDFVSLFAALREVGYGGFVSAELGAGYNMEPSPACRETLEVLRRLAGGM